MKKLVLAAALIALSTAAHAQNDGRAHLKTAATVIPPFALGAAFPATSTFSWTTSHVGTKFWNFPWAHGRIPVLTGNYVPQAVNATGQYVHNVFDPKYFGEQLHIASPKQPSGVHSTSAKYKYKEHHSRKSSNTNGKIAVGCIFGSATGAITAAIRKGNALGNPLRWRSQAEHEVILASGVEKKFELTNEEASTAVALCGLGSLTLRW